MALIPSILTVTALFWVLGSIAFTLLIPCRTLGAREVRIGLMLVAAWPLVVVASMVADDWEDR